MFDIDDALHHLLADDGHAPEVAGVPLHESTRSVAAARVARAAAGEGLRLFHFEHRALLDVPVAWQPGPEAAAQPAWTGGVLPEPKYGAFRHDQGIGSFHPGHRAKWSAHELCHGLVGTAWHPGASPLFHATAGRLAELLPVVLWYTLDEIGLQRCPRHTGPLFRSHCLDCEAAAAEGSGPVHEATARHHLATARAYVEQELAAVEATLATGVPVHHVHGSLDLCSDGIAYAASHGPRLGSPGFAAWAERYLTPAFGGYPDLDALRERVVSVLRYLTIGEPLAARGADRRAWEHQDVAARVLQGLDGDADESAAVWDRLDADDLEGAIHTYAERADALGGQHPADVFAPGYDLLPGVGRAVDQLEEGLSTVVPMTLQLAEDAEFDLIEPFVAAEQPVRRPLGMRFAAWLEHRASEQVAGLARYEAMLRAAGGEAELQALGEGTGCRWAAGVQRWSGAFEPVTFAEAVEQGSVSGHDDDGHLHADPAADQPTHLAIGRGSDGALVLVALPSTELAELPVPAREELRNLGLVLPGRWSA